MHRSPADRERRDALHDHHSEPNEATNSVPAAQRLSHLTALSRALKESTGFQLELVPVPALALHVVNLHAANMADTITCDFHDGIWWFVWSWGDPIGPAQDISGAANAIRHVLAPRQLRM